MTGLRLMVAALLLPGLAISSPVASTPEASTAAPPDAIISAAPSGATSHCLDGLPEPSTSLAPGIFHAGALTSRNESRRVDADNGTIVAALALAAATRENLTIRDLTNWTNETQETCTFDLSAAQNETLLAILGLPVRSNVSAASLSITFRTHCAHTVELAQGTALAAIALARSGGDVHVADVLTTSETCHTELQRDEANTLQPPFGRVAPTVAPVSISQGKQTSRNETTATAPARPSASGMSSATPPATNATSPCVLSLLGTC